ncbi:MAG: hypothetical protein WB735_02915, partial [Pseudonocardiaceae bacterium]
MSRPLRPIAVLAIVLALGGCAMPGSRQVGDVPGSRLGADVSQYQAGPAGRVPPGLERFYSQRLTWSGCKDSATTDFDRQS